MPKTSPIDNSNLNKALDTYIQTYKQATTAPTRTNKPRHYQGQRGKRDLDTDRWMGLSTDRQRATDTCIQTYKQAPTAATNKNLKKKTGHHQGQRGKEKERETDIQTDGRAYLQTDRH